MTTSTWIVLFICCFLCPMTTFIAVNADKKKKKANDMDKEKKEN